MLMVVFNNLLSILSEKESVGKIFCSRYLMIVQVPQDCHKAPQTQQLKTTDIYCFTVLEVSSPKSGGPREEYLFASSSFQKLSVVLGSLGLWPHHSSLISVTTSLSSPLWQRFLPCLSQGHLSLGLLPTQNDLFNSRALT